MITHRWLNTFIVGLFALCCTSTAFGADTKGDDRLAAAQPRTYTYVVVLSRADKATAFVRQYATTADGKLGSVPLSEATAPRGAKYIFADPKGKYIFAGNGGYALWMYRIGKSGHLSPPEVEADNGSWDNRVLPNLVFAPFGNVAYSTIGDVHPYQLLPTGHLVPVEPTSLIAQLPPVEKQGVVGMTLDPKGRYAYAMVSIPGVPIPGGFLAQAQVLPDGALRPLTLPALTQLAATFEYPQALCIAPNGKTVYAAHEFGVSVYHIQPDHTLKYIQRKTNEVEASETGQNNGRIMISASGKYLYTLSYTENLIFRAPLLVDGRLGSWSSLLLHDDGTVTQASLTTPKEGLSHTGQIDYWYCAPNGRYLYFLDIYHHKLTSYSVTHDNWRLTGQSTFGDYDAFSIVSVQHQDKQRASEAKP